MRRLIATMIRRTSSGSGLVARQSNAFAYRSGRESSTCAVEVVPPLPAAEMVGPAGYVLGVDLAEKLLELARKKAAEQFRHPFGGSKCRLCHCHQDMKHVCLTSRSIRTPRQRHSRAVHSAPV